MHFPLIDISSVHAWVDELAHAAKDTDDRPVVSLRAFIISEHRGICRTYQKVSATVHFPLIDISSVHTWVDELAHAAKDADDRHVVCLRAFIISEHRGIC